MKTRITILSIFMVSFVNAQIFHVSDTSAVLIKTTNQSPAHWYIEIINDVGVDTTLRWVAHFTNIPNEWVINFDDQNTNVSPLSDLDSADFVLHPLVDLPQKLIIGAMLNNRPGHGIVYFDIFNPKNRSEFQTISYEFIISTSGINEFILPAWLSNKGNVLCCELGNNCYFKVMDWTGKKLGEAYNELNMNTYSGGIIVQAFSGDKQAVFRFFQP